MNLIRKYYAVQAARGISAAKATRLLPRKVINQIVIRARVKRHGNVIDGFSRYELPLLASYSRSGTNWMRYFIETVTNRPTPGQFRCVSGTDYVVDRAHRAFPVLHKYERVLLVVRGYKECLLRHNKDYWFAAKGVQAFLEDSRYEQPCAWYIENIKAFDGLQCPKLLIYYEDLMSSPHTEFKKIGAFLKFPEEGVGDFLDNLEGHFKESVFAYTAGGHSSETTQNRGLRTHAEALLTDEQQREFDDYFLNRYPELARTYLKRYHYCFQGGGAGEEVAALDGEAAELDSCP